MAARERNEQAGPVLTGQSVLLIVKRRAKAAGYAAHSLCAGRDLL